MFLTTTSTEILLARRYVDEEKAAKEQSALNQLKQKMKKMKAEMAQLKKAQEMEIEMSDNDDDDEGDPDKLPTESEDEDEDESATVILQPSVRLRKLLAILSLCLLRVVL